MPTSSAAAGATQPPPTATEPPPPTSLMRRAIHSSGWTLFSSGTEQAIRLGTSILLAYLLMDNGKEAFGLMLFMSICMIGLAMFSDVGIGSSIIQSPRGTDPVYLNTAWTLQVARGFVLWLGAVALAYPASVWWNEPRLLYLLPVIGVTAAISGFNSTSLFTLSRELVIAKIVAVTLGSQILGVVVMATWAWFDPSVWALVVGGIAVSLARMLGSHLLVRPTNRFTWDRDAALDLFRFGRWIFLSTLVTFLGMRADQLILPRLLGFEMFGVFSIAVAMCSVVPLLTNKFLGAVGFPALAELHRRDPARFRKRLRHVRLALILPGNAALLFLAGAGPWLIGLLYPEPFHEAGWMLTALACGMLPNAVNESYHKAQLAMGNSLYMMIYGTSRVVVAIPAALIGYYLGGAPGFIYGMASVLWLIYPVQALLAIRARVWQPEIDLPVLLASGAAVIGLLQWL